MTTLDAEKEYRYQHSDDVRFCTNEDSWRRLLTRPLIVAMLSGSTLFVLGCQGAPVMPLGFGPPFDNVFGVLVLLLVGAALYRLLAPRFRDKARSKPVGSAELIARERYARGEITESEFSHILRTLDAR